MTALEKYIRLEALGQWREAQGAPAREVVVRFGDTTLLLTDTADRPLGHWALAGVQAIRTDGPLTVYAMSPEGAESLAIRDRDMTDAIAAVTRAHLHRDAPVLRTRKNWLPALAAAALLALVAALFPALIEGQAARMAPPDALEVFGDEMLLQIMATRGPLCADPAGRRALAALANRIAPGDAPRLRALDLGPAPVALLPGRTVLIGRAALSRAEDPAEIAGWIALALAREHMAPGPQRLMHAVGPWTSLRYVLTGRLSDEALARATRAAFDPALPGEIDAAIERLRGAGVATAPFADGLRRFGIDAHAAPTEGAAALSDQEWVALQGLCD